MTQLKIGWIGTGVMGKSMCMKLLRRGHSVTVFNKTKSKATELIENGATWLDSSEEIGRQSQLVFTIVGHQKDVEDVILGENGILKGAKSGTTIVDMTTSEPSLARRIQAEAEKKSVETLDAPVSGGDIGAREGKLAIMVGGKEETFNYVLPYFQIFGENIALMGSSGCGQHTKMSNQILIASTMVGVCESLLYAHRAGLDSGQVIDIIGKGAASCWSINNLGRRIIANNFEPGFLVRHFIKDMGIALEECTRMNLSLPGLALANRLYLATTSRGFENLGTQALYKALEEMNNTYK